MISDNEFNYLVSFREAKCGGVNTIRRLVMYHPDTVNAQLHTVVLAMLNEVSITMACHDQY